ncbi:CDP-glycerol glycerophosphotransferase family protein [Vibrio lentus]|nr:CDP-glycerol glycerophosphotransferase family protein [Vibrio lentus]
MRFIAYFTPLNKKIWIFGNIYGYKDNPKYLYEYIQREEKTIRPIWISRNKNDLEASGIGEGYYYLSLKGLAYQYRASVVFLATGQNDVANFTLPRKIIIQLWHGIPIKKLLLDSEETSPIPKKFKLLNRIFFSILKNNLKKYSLICAVNEHNRICMANAFGLSLDKVKVTGIPRHDIIIESIESKPLKAGDRRILYAPTWRSSLSEAKDAITAVLIPELLEYCQGNNVFIDISIHPLNQELIECEELFLGVNKLICQDVNERLIDYDLLITDYSSIAFDFSVLGRPVLFSCFDIEKYNVERGLYSDFHNLLVERNVVGKKIAKEIEINLNGSVKFGSIYHYPTLGDARKNIVREVMSFL